MHVSKLCLLTICCTVRVSSFTPNNLISSRRKSYHKLNLSDRGWDNANYLDALGSGQQSIDDANDQYMRESNARAAHRERQFQTMVRDVGYEVITEEEDDGAAFFQNESPIPQPNRDNQSGGEKLRQMMEQSRQQNQGQQQIMRNQFDQPQYSQEQQPPPANYTPAPVTPQAQSSIQQGQQPSMNPEAYYQALQAWQQAMAAFQQFCAANPQVAAQMTPPPPPPPPHSFTTTAYNQSIEQQNQAPPSSSSSSSSSPPQKQEEPNNIYDYLPRRVGGNKDAYEVNNSADVYFAQLKRDSTIRTEARKRGDLETANSPFTEKGVIALGGLLSDELIAKRREQQMKSGGEFETSRDEMILPAHFQGEDDRLDKGYTGSKYKEKLLEAKKRRGPK